MNSLQPFTFPNIQQQPTMLFLASNLFSSSPQINSNFPLHNQFSQNYQQYQLQLLQQQQNQYFSQIQHISLQQQLPQQWFLQQQCQVQLPEINQVIIQTPFQNDIINQNFNQNNPIISYKESLNSQTQPNIFESQRLTIKNGSSSTVFLDIQSDKKGEESHSYQIHEIVQLDTQTELRKKRVDISEDMKESNFKENDEYQQDSSKNQNFRATRQRVKQNKDLLFSLSNLHSRTRIKKEKNQIKFQQISQKIFNQTIQESNLFQGCQEDLKLNLNGFNEQDESNNKQHQHLQFKIQNLERSEESDEKSLLSHSNEKNQMHNSDELKRISKRKLSKMAGELQEAKEKEEKIKIRLIEDLSDEMKEIVKQSIQINRQNINRNLLKQFTSYITTKISYTLSYKTSDGSYYFKNCQNNEVIRNDSPTETEKKMFIKKFKKFMTTKQHSNDDIKQLIQNQIYGKLFACFLEQESVDWVINSIECDKKKEYLLIIKFYQLCTSNLKYLLFMNDSLSLNRKNIFYFINLNSGYIDQVL